MHSRNHNERSGDQKTIIPPGPFDFQSAKATKGLSVIPEVQYQRRIQTSLLPGKVSPKQNKSNDPSENVKHKGPLVTEKA